MSVGLMLGTHVSVAGGFLKACDRAEFLGVDCAQLFAKNERQWKGKPIAAEDAAGFRERREAIGLAVVVSHDSYLINLASGKEEIVEKSVAAFADELDRADLLGLEWVVTHPGSHTGDGADVGIERFAARLDAILSPRAPGAGVLLEVTAGQGTALGASFEEIARILEGLSPAAKRRAGVCLDTCHAFAAGYDLSTAAGFRSTWKEFDRLIGMDRLKCLHVNDSKKGLGSRVDRHEHIGQGALGELPFRLIMTSEEFRGVPKILETEKSEDLHEDVMNLALLRGFARG